MILVFNISSIRRIESWKIYFENIEILPPTEDMDWDTVSLLTDLMVDS